MPALKIKFLGIEFPAKRWAIGALSVIVILTLSSVCYVFIKGHLETDEKSSYEYHQMQEATNHFTEAPQEMKDLFNDVRGKVTASFFNSDGCIAIARYKPDALKAYSLQWIFDKHKVGDAPGALGGRKSTSSFGLAFGGEAEDPCAGICFDPHPDMGYEWWWGDRSDDDPCWIVYWIEYQDGCRGYQWYNSCYSMWGDASYWVCCVHSENEAPPPPQEKK
jgi:hypothetical protein